MKIRERKITECEAQIINPVKIVFISTKKHNIIINNRFCCQSVGKVLYLQFLMLLHSFSLC